jgi:bacterioferritin-associated ferredoxin
MIVCVCNAVCEREIEMLIASGVDTPEAIERHCGAGGDCGTCRPDVQNLIDRNAADREAPRAGPARCSLPVIQPAERAA